MYILGLTGGIGSGKSTIGKWFLEKGIPVYDSDKEAKLLMNENPSLKSQLIDLFGPETYLNNEYNRKFVAEQVFENKEKLAALNAIVHPAVFHHFQEWVSLQNSEFVVKEAAILFESGSYKDCDFILTVAADESIRIQRVMERDQVTQEQVQARIANQWTDEQRIEKSDFVLYNNASLEDLKNQFHKTYKKLLKRIQRS
ncbi:dephospho-CoA kinase [Moheibacter stercoris]|uniref:Dephospho-CoA kinase n=1 Tax=Moheibacter stercoris TaxID=1628251 RepID=A0ABV2LTN3_9FLAO